MQIIKPLTFGLLMAMAFLVQGELWAQAIGEYGKTVGSVGQRQGGVSQKVSATRSQNSKNKAVVEGIEGTAGHPVPAILVVASRQAVLYPRQDDEAEKIADLAQGDTLVPMGQSNGGNEWYMVKTQKGLIGWVKSSEVREETGKSNN
jgi:hypothetical protein